MKPNIALLLPTRQRPGGLRLALESAFDTAAMPDGLEVILITDEDDHLTQQAILPKQRISQWVGPREEFMAKRINFAARNYCTADILMCAADDIEFRTKGWDQAVLDDFARYPDRILLTGAWDGHTAKDFVTHPFISREWMAAVGYVFPEYFVADMADLWLHEVGQAIGRQHVLTDVLIEHLHMSYDLSPLDSTYLYRRELYLAKQPQKLYETPQMVDLRIRDAAALQQCIDFHRASLVRTCQIGYDPSRECPISNPCSRPDCHKGPQKGS